MYFLTILEENKITEKSLEEWCKSWSCHIARQAFLDETREAMATEFGSDNENTLQMFN